MGIETPRAPGTARSDLGDVDTRLRRGLNLEGLLPLDYHGGELIAAVVVGDFTIPGMPGQALRAFVASSSTTGGVGTKGRWFKAQRDLIIDRIVATATANSEAQLFYLGAAEADPVTIASAPTQGSFLDRAISTETPPLFMSAATDTTGGSQIGMPPSSTVFGVTMLQQGVFAPVPFCLEANAKIMLYSATGIVFWSIRGRTLTASTR